MSRLRYRVSEPRPEVATPAGALAYVEGKISALMLNDPGQFHHRGKATAHLRHVWALCLADGLISDSSEISGYFLACYAAVVPLDDAAWSVVYKNLLGAAGILEPADCDVCQTTGGCHCNEGNR